MGLVIEWLLSGYEVAMGWLLKGYLVGAVRIFGGYWKARY